MEPDAGDDGGERPAGVDAGKRRGEMGGESMTGVEKPDEDGVLICG